MSELLLAPRRDSLMGAALASRNFVIGAAITAVFALGALLSLFWTPYPPAQQNIASRFQLPSAAHWLGTDHFGRDMLSMILVGAQTSITVALIAVSVGIVIGTPLGLLAAASRRGSLVDEIVMRTNDLVFAFPALLIAVLITAIFGPGAVNAIIAIGIFNIPVFARLSRGAALSLWQREFIMAARVAGKSKARISAEHILPNILNTLVVQATIQFAIGILSEAALAYVGLGAQPPIPSWGKMLADSQTMIAIAPHVALVPGIAIVLAVLGVNLMGDGLRDILDPQLRRSRR
jgi:peptide/nickel transport system permease protein